MIRGIFLARMLECDVDIGVCERVFRCELYKADICRLYATHIDVDEYLSGVYC